MKKYSCLILALFVICPLFAELSLPALFSDHAVLAASAGTPVWGWAAPGEKVTVSIAGISASVQADSQGNWRTTLDLSKAAPGPHEMKINDKIIRDVLIGEVWLASGQSNVMLHLYETENFEAEAAKADDREFRYFAITIAPSAVKQPKLSGKWVLCTPQNCKSFTAFGYYFAKALRRELKRPVGLLHASRGATSIVSWMSRENLEEFPTLVRQDEENERSAREYPEKMKNYLAAQTAWEKEFNRADRPAVMPEKWSEPKDFARAGEQMPGGHWRKLSVPVTAEMRQKGLLVEFGHHSDLVEMYLNGKKMYANSAEQAAGDRGISCRIPAAMLTGSEIELAIRHFHSRGKMRLNPTLMLNGINHSNAPCAYADQFLLPLPAGECARKMPKHPGGAPWVDFFASRLYNGMIHPLAPFRLSGVIWYQGEADRDNPPLYKKVFPSLILAWRKHFENPALPFIFCQLAAYQAKTSNPDDPGLAKIRDAQSAALKLPHTGMAVLTDCGEAEDIHPRDKRTPGERAAALALRRVYGKNIPDAGPELLSAAREGNALRLRFSNLYGGLVAKPVPATHILRSSANRTAPLVRNSPDTQLEGFALCDDDYVWHWADKAVIDGGSVVVSSEKIPLPRRVRYNWSSNPSGNLFNQAGFPAVPFQSKTVR